MVVGIGDQVVENLMQARAVGTDECRQIGSLTQHVPPQEKSGLHYFHHSFIASETVSEVIAPMLHINCRQLASATPSLRPSEKSPLPCSNRPANPHPDAVDYYVFSLGKIRI